MSYRSQLYYEKFRELLSKGFDHDTANGMSVRIVDEELDGKPKPKPMTPLQICNRILDEVDPEGARVREAIINNGPEVNATWRSHAQEFVHKQILPEVNASGHSQTQEFACMQTLPEVNPVIDPEWKRKLDAQQAIASQIEADRIFAEKLQEELNVQ